MFLYRQTWSYMYCRGIAVKMRHAAHALVSSLAETSPLVIDLCWSADSYSHWIKFSKRSRNPHPSHPSNVCFLTLELQSRSSCLQVVCGDDPQGQPKPAAHNAKMICDQLKVDASETVMVGDTKTDMEFAKVSAFDVFCLILVFVFVQIFCLICYDR